MLNASNFHSTGYNVAKFSPPISAHWHLGDSINQVAHLIRIEWDHDALNVTIQVFAMAILNSRPNYVNSFPPV
jgi:hypothetical protein